MTGQGLISICQLPLLQILLNHGILGIYLLIFSSGTNGRRCYVCSTLFDWQQFDCLYAIERDGSVEDSLGSNVTIANCSYYCTIRREEYADAPGGLNYLNRSCEEIKFDEVVIGGYFITYRRSCKSDLCNGGDGINSLSGLPEDEDVIQLGHSESATSVAVAIYAIPVIVFASVFWTIMLHFI